MLAAENPIGQRVNRTLPADHKLVEGVGISAGRQRHELFGSGGGEKVAEMAKAPLLGQIPIDPEVRKQGDEGLPIVQAAPSSPAGDALHRIAEKLVDLIAKAHFDRTGGSKAPKAENAKRLRIIR